MSRMVRYKGKAVKLERHDNETLEQQCQRLIGGNLEEYWESWKEKMSCNYYEEYVICNNDIYKIIKCDEIEYEQDVFDANKNKDGVIDFHVMFYNGGCCLSEAIEYAINDMNE